MEREYTRFQKAAAWSVHAFTASGLVAGFMAILAIQEHDFRAAALWLLLCQVIDGVDGTFARMANVKEVLPNVNGGTIDYVIDFATYAIIPTYFFYEAGLVEDTFRLPLSALILMVSALYYGKEGMVSEDYCFIGFPVMWNMVMFFIYFIFSFSFVINAILIVFFAILHFVPIKFVYPSRSIRFQGLTIGIVAITILTLLFAIWFFPEKYFWLSVSGFACVLYYAIMAIYDTWIVKE